MRRLDAAQRSFDDVDAEDARRDADGHARLARLRHKPDELDAELAAFQERRRMRLASTEGAKTLGAYRPQWLDEVARPRSRRATYESYRDIVEKHIVPAIGDVRIVDLGPGHVRALLNAKLAERQKRRSRSAAIVRGQAAGPGQRSTATDRTA
jgi:hypothetical protein